MFPLRNGDLYAISAYRTFSSVAQACLSLGDSVDSSTPGLPVHHQLPVYSNSCPLSWSGHPTISPSVIPFSSCLQSFLASGSFQMSQLFAWGGQSNGVSASASVLPMNTQVGSPCSPRDSQESSPTPQFKSINSLALRFLYSPTLTSIHDYRKNQGFD